MFIKRYNTLPILYNVSATAHCFKGKLTFIFINSIGFLFESDK